MGLDMYLERRTYVKNWQHIKPEELHKITVEKNGEPVKTIKPERISYIMEEVAYWRKANQIHAWLTKNEDNDTFVYVDSYQLRELLEVCKKVKASLEAGGLHKVKVKDSFNENEQEIEVYRDTEVAEAELPTQEGFFFGSYSYDKYYMEDLDYTIKTIRKLLKEEHEGAGVDYIYTASY